MKLALPMLLLFLCTAAGQDRPEDGFYLRVREGGARSVAGQDGKKLFLGERAPLQVSRCRLQSEDNANNRFSLGVDIPYDEAVNTGTYVLVANGTGYPQGGCGASGKEISSLYFQLDGEEAAKTVGAYLGTPVLCRSHPGYLFRVTLTPGKETFAPGEDVTVTLRIVNVGTKTVAFMKGGRNRADRDNQYVFSAYLRGKQVEDIGTTYHFGGLAVKVVLKPGETFEDTVSLSKWFAFKEAGTYEIHGSYYLDFQDPDSKASRTIWEDRVAADCVVSVAAP